MAVPRIFEKIYNGAEARAEAAGKGKIFRKAAETAVAYSEAMDKKRISPLLTLKHGLFDKLVYSKIRAGMGGRVEAAISGGAPLGVIVFKNSMGQLAQLPSVESTKSAL